MNIVLKRESIHQIVFYPLGFRDLADLHLWLNRPRVRRFFQRKPVSQAEVVAKYGPRIRGEVPIHCHLAYSEAYPFGYLQCYRLADRPERAALIEADAGVGVDLAIFDPDMLGKGFGRAMLAGYLRHIVFSLFPSEHKCFITHRLGDEAALACAKSVGFRHVRNFSAGGFESALLVFERDKTADSRG
jgi:RimJ/RimL family protein N-acetyltransferase